MEFPWSSVSKSSVKHWMQLTSTHSVKSPLKVPPAARQSSSVTSTHEPSERQHAPGGCGQVTSPHVVLSPLKVPPSSLHSSSVTSTHEPSIRQHAPGGCGQKIDWLSMETSSTK